MSFQNLTVPNRYSLYCDKIKKYNPITKAFEEIVSGGGGEGGEYPENIICKSLTANGEDHTDQTTIIPGQINIECCDGSKTTKIDESKLSIENEGELINVNADGLEIRISERPGEDKRKVTELTKDGLYFQPKEGSLLGNRAYFDRDEVSIFNSSNIKAVEMKKDGSLVLRKATDTLTTLRGDTGLTFTKNNGDSGVKLDSSGLTINNGSTINSITNNEIKSASTTTPLNTAIIKDNTISLNGGTGWKMNIND